MLYQKKGDTVLDSGKVFTVGGEVFANHACDYEGLFGTVTEIRTGPDQCAEQGAPDICCAFLPAEDGRLLSLTCFYDSDCGCNAQTLALSNDMGLVLRKMREDLDTYEIPVVLSHVERLIDGYRFSYEAKDAGVESLYLSYTISGVPVFLQQPAGHA